MRIIDAVSAEYQKVSGHKKILLVRSLIAHIAEAIIILVGLIPIAHRPAIVDGVGNSVTVFIRYIARIVL